METMQKPERLRSVPVAFVVLSAPLAISRNRAEGVELLVPECAQERFW